MTTVTMLDTVTVSAIGRIATSSQDAFAGYIDGRYRNIAQMEADYPNHRHLAIAVFPWDNGDCLDIETGDATPEDAPGWVRRQHARGVARPWLYANESTWPHVSLAMSKAGIPRNAYIKWVALYDGIPQLTSDWQAKQYTDHWMGRNVDASVVDASVFDLPVRPRPKPRRIRGRRVRKPIHRKVIGATGAGACGTGAVALIHFLGVTITPAEASGVAAFLSALAGYLTPAGKGTS